MPIRLIMFGSLLTWSIFGPVDFRAYLLSSASKAAMMLRPYP